MTFDCNLKLKSEYGVLISSTRKTNNRGILDLCGRKLKDMKCGLGARNVLSDFKNNTRKKFRTINVVVKKEEQQGKVNNFPPNRQAGDN